MVRAAERGEGTGLGGPRDHAPKGQVKRNVELSAADRVSSRPAEGVPVRRFPSISETVCREDSGDGRLWGRGGGGRPRGVRGEVEEERRRSSSYQAQMLSPRALKSSQESTQDCHSFVSESFSPGKDTLALSHEWKTCNGMKIHGGREDRWGRPPHVCIHADAHACGQGALRHG